MGPQRGNHDDQALAQNEPNVHEGSQRQPGQPWIAAFQKHAGTVVVRPSHEGLESFGRVADAVVGAAAGNVDVLPPRAA